MVAMMDHTKTGAFGHYVFGERLEEDGEHRVNFAAFGADGVYAAAGESVSELFRRTGLLEATYSKQPIEALVANDDGSTTRVPLPQYAVMLHTPDGQVRPVGAPVAKNYTLLQNRTIANVLDRITSRFPVDAVASLQDGGLTMVSFNAGKFCVRGVAGEETQQYLRVTHGVGGFSLRFAVTSVRLFCTNTLHAAWDNADARWSFRHHKNIEDDFEAVCTLADAMDEANRRMRGDLENMAGRQISDADALAVFNAAYKPPTLHMRAKTVALVRAMNLLNPDISPRWMKEEQDYMAQLTGHARRKEAFLDQYHLFGGALAHTAYAAYQTVALLGDATPAQTAQKHVVAVLEGDIADRTRLAYRAALALADPNNN